MKTTLAKARKGDRDALKKYQTAFGKNANMDIVEETIKRIQKEPLRVQTANPALLDQLKGDKKHGALTMPNMPGGKSPKLAGPVLVGSGFYDAKGMNDKMRGSALIHEAAHQHMLHGDDIDGKTGRVLTFGTKPTHGKVHKEGGCEYRVYTY
jgi:hypothetical protein